MDGRTRRARCTGRCDRPADAVVRANRWADSGDKGNIVLAAKTLSQAHSRAQGHHESQEVTSNRRLTHFRSTLRK